MERATLEINPPRDKFNIIFFILLLHGIGTLMPWNMFITAKSVRIFNFFIQLVKWLSLMNFYWMFFFVIIFWPPQYFIDYKMSANYTGVHTEYVTYYEGSSTLAAQIPNFVLNWLNIFLNLGYVFNWKVIKFNLKKSFYFTKLHKFILH